METRRTLQPRRILHAPAAISIHGSFRQGSLEPGPSGQELGTLPTIQLRPVIYDTPFYHFIKFTMRNGMELMFQVLPLQKLVPFNC